jgi:carbon-monoxide dehydrogenase medium subunit
MYSVNYHRAASVSEAAKLLKIGDAKLLSGGMTLIPAMKTRLAAPSDLVDISRIEALKGITVSGRTVTIGAGTTHYEVATSEKLRKVCPALPYMASLIGDPAVRHKGTLGGSIANNDPAADYPAAMLALGATIITNKRQLPAEKFFKGLFETALKDGEIVTAVSFTAPAKAGYEKFRNPASRYAIVGVFVSKGKDGVRVAVTGAGDDGVFRSKVIEAALAKSFEPAALEGVKVPADGLMSDIHASAEYRAHLIVVMAKRAVAAANG